MGYLSDQYKPKYLQLCEIIRDAIDLGKYKKGERLPSESELEREFNVSSITVRKCIDILKNEGLIERVQGVGTFIKVNRDTRYNAENLVFGVNTLFCSNEWCAEVLRGIQKVIKGAKGTVFHSDALGDTGRQKDDLMNMIAKKPDLIFVLQADPKTMKKTLMLAMERNIPIISVEAYLEGPVVKTHLNADQMINGIHNANNIINYLAITHNGRVKGNVLDVHTPDSYTIDLRHKAMLMKFAEYPQINIARNISFDWSNILEDTRIKVESYLTKHADEIDVITAHFGEPLVGAALAVENLGLGDKIKVIGIDAFEAVIDLMKQGKCIIAAVQQDGYAMGIVAAKVGLKVLSGEKVPFEYILPLANIYSNFPHMVDNYPENGKVKIPSPSHFKEMGLDWGY
jgi:ABC-type sugar transport system substrate-binding protein